MFMVTNSHDKLPDPADSAKHSMITILYMHNCVF